MFGIGNVLKKILIKFRELFFKQDLDANLWKNQAIYCKNSLTKFLEFFSILDIIFEGVENELLELPSEQFLEDVLKDIPSKTSHGFQKKSE